MEKANNGGAIPPLYRCAACLKPVSRGRGAILLMGMGYRKLSMNAFNLRKINWVVRNVNLSEAQSLLSCALTSDSYEEVFNHINQYLEVKGLGGLVRAGS